MKNDKPTVNMIKNAITTICDYWIKAKGRSMLEVMISICKEIGYSDDVIAVTLYEDLLLSLDKLEKYKGGEE